MSTAMLMLNGPLRTDLPEELIKPLKYDVRLLVALVGIS
jgi:hypothetical protein